MGIFDRNGGGPMDFLRNRISSWQAHPFQNMASTAFGAFVPGGGLLANAAFDRFNNNQFNNSANAFQNLTRDQTQLDTNNAMNKPLAGPLGQYDRNNPYGDQTSAQGMGGGMNGGGPSYGGGYNSQNWNLQDMTSGHAPNQPSSFVNDILNSISTGPGQPGTQQGGLFGNGGENGPEARRDGSWNGGMNPGANYGISNMMANGSQMITGYDPNQMVMANGRRNMY